MDFIRLVVRILGNAGAVANAAEAVEAQRREELMAVRLAARVA
jgi:hypothetical protein